MKIASKSSGRLSKTPLLVAFSVKGKLPSLPEGVTLSALTRKDFTGEQGKSVLERRGGTGIERVLLIGLGKASAVNPESLRRAAAQAVKAADAVGVREACFWVGDDLAKHCSKGVGDLAEVGNALAEGACMGAYRFQACKSESKPAKLQRVHLWGAGSGFASGVKRGTITGEANLYVRGLQNEPGNRMTPRKMASEARALAARSARIRCTVMDAAAIRRAKMGLLLSVAQGSSQPPVLLHLVYKPKSAAKKRVALVGKGLTFDAGGYSLKPSSKMEEMRFDMSGGAAVLGVFHALASLDVPCEVHGVVPCSENLINGKATKPGDVHTGMNGKTVEVLNTDAEGRLILADALSYTAKKIKPDATIDLATLTGAVVVALGHELSGMFTHSDELRDALLEAGEATGERLWPLPLLDLHKEAMKGTSADLKNIASGDVGAGSTTAAAFLSHFAEEVGDWCHLDIAGTAWGGRQRQWVGGPQGSGVGTRLLIHYLESASQTRRGSRRKATRRR